MLAQARWRSFGIGVALLVLAGTACSGNDQAQAVATHPTGPELAADLLPTAPSAQQDALRDGIVTSAEYESAIDATAKCVEAHPGLRVIRQPGQATGGATQLLLAFSMQDLSQDEATNVFRACTEQNRGKLDLVWAEQNRPTPEQADQILASHRACLSERGFESLSGRFYPDVAKEFGADSPQVAAWTECADKANSLQPTRITLQP